MSPQTHRQPDAVENDRTAPSAGGLDPNAYRSGEPDALEAVYRDYVDQVAALVRRGFVYSRAKVVVVPGVAEPQTQLDLIQETFLRLFSEQARQAYDSDRPLRPYLLRIVKNLMIDRLRRSGREVSPPTAGGEAGVGDIDELIDSDQPIPDDDPASVAHWSRQRKATLAWVAGLPEELAALYGLRYEMSLGQEQTAKRLGISRRRVRTLEGRLRRSLRKYLKKNGLWP